MNSRVLLSTFTCLFLMGGLSISPCIAQPSTDSAPKPIATVSTGQLRGSLTYDGEAVFKNIPFAEAPAGDLRWREPRPAKAWSGIREATSFGPACPQSGHLDVVSSEDCLQLNIWTPTWPMKSPAPVMVWFHGGGNVAGSAIEPLFNGENFARLGVVLVSANYRLGVFGFFAHPELTSESVHHSSGNYGLLDQIMALRWVHDNIANFGGDPANVTIFGESAGSMDVNTLLTSPVSAGLFTRAIAESGAITGGPMNILPALADAEKGGEALAAKMGITGAGALAKLRAVSKEDLLKAVAQNGGPGAGRSLFGMDIDGWVLPEAPTKVFSSGREHHVALLLGNNSQEVQRAFGASSDDVRTSITKQFGPLSDRVLTAYGFEGGTDPKPDAEFGTANAQWATDVSFRCGTIQELIWHASAGNPTFQYQFSISVHGKESDGAPHAAEIPFVFGTLPVWQGMRHYRLSDRQYAPSIQEYWVNFAKTGDPNSAGLPAWSKFDASTRSYIDFTDAGPVAKEGLRRSICDLFMENDNRLTAKQP